MKLAHYVLESARARQRGQPRAQEPLWGLMQFLLQPGKPAAWGEWISGAGWLTLTLVLSTSCRMSQLKQPHNNLAAKLNQDLLFDQLSKFLVLKVLGMLVDC